jgi:hypothetical protein
MADYKVKLVRAASIINSASKTSISQPSQTGANLQNSSNSRTGLSSTREQVVFDVTPEFSENRTINYKNIDPIHAPGAVYMYANTNARTFSITAKFISRSINEATVNLAYIQYLRTWAMPTFGTIGANPAPGEGILGAPPAILLLTAYSLGNPGATQVTNTTPGSDGIPVPNIGNNIYQIPVIMTSLDIPYPSDVDYIPTKNNIPVPTIQVVSISLTEAHSPNAYQKFTLQDYKTGRLTNF